MKYSTTLAVLAMFFATVANALPTRRGIADPQVLNFALALEHLEFAFYQQGLDQFSSSDFDAAGFPDWVRARFEQIREHEATHVEFLSTALGLAGASAVAPCEYNLWIPLSLSCEVLEAVGATAYTGGAALVNDKVSTPRERVHPPEYYSTQEYLTAAASILAVEARHAAWISSAAQGHNAWDTAFQPALTPNQVYTVATSFIESCPASNADSLPPLTVFAPLAVTTAHPGRTATLTFAAPTSSKSLYAAFISSIAVPVFVPIHNGNQVVVPHDLLGFAFCVVTTKDGGDLDDSTTVAGPAVLNFPFDSRSQTL
ncbi:Protein rds1 [Mycena sanguinolenta]|uniref:Protein rds1 n=1 Tax=Mycena sanguinolenta TaxID=230812 RepID=A0A8H7DLF6_9AGAR|nr:Protein rds1 [Mycena sanguinolenta]